MDTDFSLFDNSISTANKINKSILFFIIVNMLINLIFCVVVCMTMLFLINSPIIKTLNNDVPKISSDIQNYLNVYIPLQLDKINQMENYLTVILENFNVTLTNINIVTNNANNIINIPDINGTINSILSCMSVLLDQLVMSNIPAVGSNIIKIATDLDTIIQKMDN